MKLTLFVDSKSLYIENPKDSTAAAAAKLLHSCPTLCDPIDGSPSASSVPGILQARVESFTEKLIMLVLYKVFTFYLDTYCKKDNVHG